MLPFILSFQILQSALSFAQTNLRAEYTIASVQWCNGPVRNGKAKDCPSYSSWKGLRLKNLKKVSFDITADHEYVRLEANDAAVWEADLKMCVDKPGPIMGCSHNADFSNHDKIKMNIRTWDPGSPTELLSVIVEKQTKLHVMGPDHALIIFDVKPRM